MTVTIESCPHCGASVEVRTQFDSLHSRPEVGLQCQGCPVGFFLKYDDTKPGERAKTLDAIIAAWNRRAEEG